VAGLVHRGEGVLNQEEIRALGGEAGFNALRQSIRAGHAMGGMAGRPGAVAGGGQYQAGVPVIINFHGASERPERAETKMGNQGLEIDLIFRQVERQIAGRVEAGSSPINQAFERRYGARPTF